MHHNQEEELQHFTATTLIRSPFPALNQVLTAPQQIKAPQPINNIQPPQAAPTRISPTDWNLLQQQQVQSIQIVQHQSGATAYKATLSNGQQLLMHNLNNNPNELIFGPEISQKWSGIGKVYKPQNVNVKQVQTSIKGVKPDARIKLDNIQKLDKPAIQPKQMTQTQPLSKPADTNVKLPKITQANAEIFGKVGGAVGGTVGSILTDVAIDGYENVKVGKAVVIGALCMIPYVGIGFQTLMASVAIGGITSSDFLSSKEKWQQIGVLSAKIGYSVVVCYSTIELGMAAGAVVGPVGVVAGGIIGGLFGGFISNIFGREVDKASQKEPFELVVSFGRANKSNIADGYMHDSGINPKCIFKNLGGAAKSIILIAQTETHIAWVLPNIKPSETVLKENCNRGLILCAQTQSRYLGPDTTQQQITFMAFGIKEEYVDENQCLRMLHDNELTIICSTEKKINL